MDTACINCGILFKTTEYKLKHGGGKYCSRECMRISIRKKTYAQSTCLECGKVIITTKNKLKNGSSKYCSRQCYYAAKNTQVEVRCVTCGKHFTKSKRKADSCKNHFCSEKCYGVFIGIKNKSPEMRKKVSDSKIAYYKKLREMGVNGSMYDTIEWKHISRNYIKSNPFCILCNSIKNLHVHHISPYKNSKSHDDSNLITLCRSCHAKVEGITRELVVITGNWDIPVLFMSNELTEIKINKYREIMKIINRE